MIKASASPGFTVIETVVTLMVAVVFALAINLLFTTIIRSTASARERTEASNLSYTYLRKYAYTGASSSWFTCSSASDMQQNANAGGQSLEGGSLSQSQTDLPQPVKYSVVALAPFGCGTSANDTSPLLIRATVIYGPDALSISHATYLEQAE